MPSHFACTRLRERKAALLTLLLTAVIALAAGTALAGPASPRSTVVTQPNGSALTVRMQGDEFQGWMETSEGYTVIRNPRSGAIEYAVRNATGALVPSGIVAVPDAANAGIVGALPAKGLRPPRDLELEAFKGSTIESVYLDRLQPANPTLMGQTGIWVPVPVSGAKKMLVILINFADTNLLGGAATYWNDAILNTGAASVAKYYQDNSYGKLALSPVPNTQPGSPAGVVTVTLARNHPACPNGKCSYAIEAEIINAALAAAAPYVDFASLDTNGDGTISVGEALMYFVWAGFETSCGTGLTPSIWAHAWGGTGVAVSGKIVPRWALNGDRCDEANRMTMGVVAHELGHQLGGLPDLYDTSNTNQGLGVFSLMASGSWGARSGEFAGRTPVGFDAWCRQYLGWSTLQTPASGQTATFVSGLQSDASTYLLMNESASTSEFWLVENRPPVSWDAGMYEYFKTTWQGGLLVQHIDLNIGSLYYNNFNRYVDGGHQGNLVVEPATSTCTLTGRNSRGCPTLLYYAGNTTTFSDSTTPASRYYSGQSSGFGLSGVSASGDSMTATFTTGVSSRVLSSLTVTGPASVDEGSTGAYTAIATYTDGSSFTVIPMWSEDSPSASISSSGVLTTGEVTGNQTAMVSASYTEGGVSRAASLAVTIVDVSAASGAGSTTVALFQRGLSGTAGTRSRYAVDVPVGAANLVFSVEGNNGDVDLYVKAGSDPDSSLSESDCASYTPYANEICTIPAPRPGTWHILLDAYSQYTGASLKVTYETPVVLTVQKSGSGSGTVRSTAVSSSYAAREVLAGAQPLIVGGSDAQAGSWPWQVLLTVALPGRTRWCGGSLLSNRWVVTAAHCIDSGGVDVPASDALIRAGTIDWGTGGQQVAVSRVIRHPQYDAISTDNDIALLELAAPVALSSTVAAIEPLLPTDEPVLIYDGRMATVTGWGNTFDGGSASATLRQVTLPLISSAACRNSAYGSDITDNMICAGYPLGEKDSCQGDSGGPLVVANGRGGYVLAGIVSWGVGCAAPNFPGVYTRVANYRAWIGSTTGLGFGQPLIDCGGNCSARLGLTSTVTLAATAAPGSSFAGWLGACSGTGSCTVTMSEARSVTANFTTVSPSMSPLMVSKHGDGIGKVTSSPEGIDCGTKCSTEVASGTRMTLTAQTRFPGSVFNGWGGACSGSGTNATCQVTAWAATTVTASFRYTGSDHARDYVQKAYFAYYGRPGDPEGRAYWAGRMDSDGGSLDSIIDAFATSDEYNARYGGLNDEELVTKIYEQTLGRKPDAGGYAFYLDQLNTGKMRRKAIALDILNGATTAPDSTVVANRQMVADHFTAKVAAGCAYGTEQTGVDALKDVTADPATVTLAEAVIDARCGP